MTPSSQGRLDEGRWRRGTGPGTNVPLTSRSGRPGRRRLLFAALLAVMATAAGCAPTPAFDPAGPCETDGRRPGAYPDLEAGLPGTFEGRPPDSLDSGRSCTEAALGALVSHDVDELRFAGVTWDLGGGRGVSIAVLDRPSGELPVAWVEEFYETGARTARKTENIETSRPNLPAGGLAYRLDTLNDLSFQTVVVWADGGVVRVALIASPVAASASRAAHDAVVTDAIVVGEAAPDPIQP